MENSEKLIVKNYSYLLSYKILSVLLPLLTAPYLSRVLGADMLGIYAFAETVGIVAIMLVRLGLLQYGVREIAAVRDDRSKLTKLFTELWSIQIAMGILTMTFYSVYLFFLSGTRLLVALCFAISSCSAVFEIKWFFSGLELFRKVAIRDTLIKIIQAAGIFLFVKKPDDVVIYALIHGLTVLISNLFYVIRLRRYADITPFGQIDFRAVYGHFKKCLLLFIPALAITVYRHMDKIMLGLLGNITQVGYYENAEKIIYSLIEFFAFFSSVMLPRMTRIFHTRGDHAGKDYLSRSMQFVMFLSCAMGFGIFVITDEFVPWFFGDSFLPSAILLKLLAITIPIIGWTSALRSQYVIPLEKDNIYMHSVCTGALINLLVNLILIPYYGAIGACAGTVAAELSVGIVQFFYLRKELSYLRLLRDSFGYLLSGIIMLAAVYLSRRYLISERISSALLILVIEIGIGMAVYFITAGPKLFHALRKTENNRSPD